jgi:short-subunit dehydrogenase
MTLSSILITGCTHGLGHELALNFARDNYKVYAVGRNAKLLNALNKNFKNIIPIDADIAKPAGRLNILETLKTNKLNFVIHNAALATPSMIDNLSEELFRDHFETNFFAPVLLNKMLLTRLEKNSRIMHISSAAAELPLLGLMPYCTSKGALEHVTNCFNAELSSKEIFFANLRPGMMATEMLDKLINSDESSLPGKKIYVNAKNDKKLSNPEDVAKYAKWVMCETENSVFSSKKWDFNDNNKLS